MKFNGILIIIFIYLKLKIFKKVLIQESSKIHKSKLILKKINLTWSEYDHAQSIIEKLKSLKNRLIKELNPIKDEWDAVNLKIDIKLLLSHNSNNDTEINKFHKFLMVIDNFRNNKWFDFIPNDITNTPPQNIIDDKLNLVTNLVKNIENYEFSDFEFLNNLKESYINLVPEIKFFYINYINFVKIYKSINDIKLSNEDIFFDKNGNKKNLNYKNFRLIFNHKKIKK